MGTWEIDTPDHDQRVAQRSWVTASAAASALRRPGMAWPGTRVSQATRTATAVARNDPLPSWNDGAAKQAVLDFVAAATDEGDTGFIPPGARIATFDQDGTLWVEHPIYSQAVFAIDRVRMLEVMNLLRASGFRTYIVSGIPPKQVIGTTFEPAYGSGANGAPTLTKVAKLQLNNNDAGKPQVINLFVGGRPAIAFGNSTGDLQMLEWANAGDRAHLAVLIDHDDAEREHAYGPAGGLPETHVGTVTDALMTKVMDDGWAIISMRNDWNRIFPWSECHCSR